MLIQPLIENAILHGLIVDPQPDAYLEVKMQKQDNKLCITVSDNGIGINNSKPKALSDGIKEKSIGLASIEERIAMLNNQGNNYSATFDIRPKSDGRGTVAIICLSILEEASSF
jgi:sensor histidine kinase YesM